MKGAIAPQGFQITASDRLIEFSSFIIIGYRIIVELLMLPLHKGFLSFLSLIYGDAWEFF